MKAIVITQAGGPEVLQLTDRPQAKPGRGEVLIRVAAAGVNRPDIAQRKGHYPPPPGASPDIPGLEVAGTVTALGEACTRWKVGDTVCALVSGGGYAEMVAVPEGQCLPIPTGMSFVDAASLPETFFTVWHNVFDRGQLEPGQSLLVHGGSSGIGVAAIQLAKASGATVYVTAGTPEKCAFCENLGATSAINYRVQDFRTTILEITQGKGVNVILDMIGADYMASNLEVLAPEGRLVLINHMRGEDASIKLSLIMKKRLSITGSTLRARDSSFKAALAGRLERHVWPWLIAKTVRAVVHKTFPLEHASDAHRLMESNSHMGKIVLVTG